MNRYDSEQFGPDRWESSLELSLDVLVERFVLHHEPEFGADAADAAWVDRPASQLWLSENTVAFVPEHYEANYAYPLIVWLSQTDADLNQLLDLMPRISTRNYLAVAMALPDEGPSSPVAGGISAGSGDWERAVQDGIVRLRDEYHVNSERIYLAGLHAGGATALELMLARPEWFCGAISFGCDWAADRVAKESPRPPALVRFRDLQDKRVLLSAGSRSSRFVLTDFVKAGRLLHAAGVQVTPKIYDTADHPPRELLREIDHWLMAGIAVTEG